MDGLKDLDTFAISKTTNSIYEDTIWFESVNVKQIDRLLNSNLLKPYDANWVQQTKAKYTHEQAHLLAIRKKVKNGIINIQYQTGRNGIGRVYPKNSISVGQLSRSIRHTICKGKWVDIDLNCCHHNIAFQLSESITGNKLENLEYYVKHREQVMHDLLIKYFGEIPKNSKIYKKRREDIKLLFIIIFYLGSFKRWTKSVGLENVQEDSYLIKLRNEMKQLARNIYKVNGSIMQSVKIKKEKLGKTATDEEILTSTLNRQNEYHSSVLSHVFGEWERRIIECCITYLKKMKIIEKNFVINCFDGFMIRQNDFNKWKKLYLSKDFLASLKQEVYDKIGFKINWSFKDLNEDLYDKLDEIDNAFETKKHTDDKLKQLDISYLNDLETYEDKKNYFENFVYYIRNIDLYVVNELYGYTQVNSLTHAKETLWERQIKTYKRIEIKNMFENIASGELTQKGEPIYLTEKWFKDPTKKTYLRMEFSPYNDVYKEDYSNLNVFNTFTGYNSLIKTSYPIEKRTKILKPFMDRLYHLCGKQQICVDLFLHIVAHKIQFPKIKLPYAFIFTSMEGEGKNVILDCFKRIIGVGHYISSSNMEDFVGMYAEGFTNKLIVNLNEIGASDSRQAERKMKSLISEDKIRVNAKFLRPTDEYNYALIVISTNEENPIKLDIRKGERRWIVCRGDGFNRKLKESQWTNHIKHFQKPEFIAALYDYLNEIPNIMDYDFKSKREDMKKTEGYLKMAENFVPLTGLWLNEYITHSRYNRFNCNLEPNYINEEDEHESEPTPYQPIHLRKSFNEIQSVKGIDLFKDYTEWSKNNKYTFETNARSFYSKLTSLNMPIINRIIHQSKFLEFKPREIYVRMIANSWFSRDEKLDQWLEEDVCKENEKVNLSEDYFDF
tara:strand:- start:761 stop:3442 length:2682 start_codon:yes stop_codon:yes gene_type:complete